MSDDLTTEQQMAMEFFTNSFLLSRLRLGQNTGHEGERNYNEVLGYPDKVTNDMLIQLFGRHDIASRIVKAYPDALWTNPPKVTDDNESDEETPFEKAFTDLDKELGIWRYIKRADTMAGLGRYSILYFGEAGEITNDDLKEESSIGEVTFMMAFAEKAANISQVITDLTNPKFGQPKTYTVDLADVMGEAAGTTTSTTGFTNATIEVHESRTVRFADNLLDNEVFGFPLLQLVYNRMMDLQKTVGGGAEMWWMNARGGLNAAIDPLTQLSAADKEAFEEEVKQFQHNLTRMIKSRGIELKPLVHAIDSPEHLFDAILSLISGGTGIPKRILTGSEAAQLASEQDENNWHARITEKRSEKEPVARSIIDRFIETGQLPEPKDGDYDLDWPELKTLSVKDKAEAANKIAGAIATYANSPESETVVPRKQFVEETLDMEFREDEIEEIEKQMEEEEREIREHDDQMTREGFAAKAKQFSPAANE